MPLMPKPPTIKPKLPTVAPSRTTGGITGPGAKMVDKVYRQMEPSNTLPPSQKMPYTPKPPTAPPNNELRKGPTTPGTPAPKKKRSAFEDNRMQ